MACDDRPPTEGEFTQMMVTVAADLFAIPAETLAVPTPLAVTLSAHHAELAAYVDAVARHLGGKDPGNG